MHSPAGDFETFLWKTYTPRFIKLMSCLKASVYRKSLTSLVMKYTFLKCSSFEISCSVGKSSPRP